MAERLIIHLGDRKTGSTSLQQTLAGGHWQAPGAPRLAYLARDHNGPLAQSLIQLGDDGAQETRFQNLARRLSRVEADVAIVSSETFEDVAPTALKRAVDRWLVGVVPRIDLVAYARPHGARMLSGYAEQVKRAQTTAGLAEFFAEGVLLDRFTMADRFARWAELFGEAFTLRPVLRDRLTGGSVVTDFLHLALGQAATLTWEAEANRSPGAAELAALRIVHGARAGAGWGPRRIESGGLALAEVLSGALAGQGGDARPGLSADLIARLRALCADDAARLDAQFFDGTPMADALAALEPGGPDTDPDTHFSPVAQRIIAALAVAEPVGG